jgi:hypothetical protein
MNWNNNVTEMVLKDKNSNCKVLNFIDRTRSIIQQTIVIRYYMGLHLIAVF